MSVTSPTLSLIAVFEVAEDLDSLVAENRFLKAKLNTAEEESESIKMTLAKYKQMAESVNVQVTSNLPVHFLRKISKQMIW